MIYYDIQHFGSFGNTQWQLENLASKDFHIHFSYDGDQGVLEESIDKSRLKLKSLNFSRSYDLTWGGASIAAQMKKSLERALLVPGWKYFINLSGRCFPLFDPNETLDILEGFSNKAKRSYCFAFRKEGEISWIRWDNTKRSRYRRVKYGRISLVMDAQIRKLYKQGLFDPIRNPLDRFAAHFEEEGSNRIRCRPLFEWEIDLRKDFLKKYSFNVGRQWVVIHRDHAEHIVKYGLMDSSMDALKNVFIPDESFWQCCFFSDLFPKPHQVNRKTNLRVKNGKRLDFQTFDFSSAREEKFLFGRKIPSQADRVDYAKFMEGHKSLNI